jgi:peptidoglycan/LPS O-acetylase OafA/YrhL
MNRNTPNKDSSISLGYLPALDGLRAISIILVLSVHLRLIGSTAFRFMPAGGFLGVDVFFVISGFLITSLLLSEHRKTRSISLSSFYWRRALRLFPALLVVLVFTGVIAIWAGSLSALGLTPLRIASVLAYFTNWVRAFETPQTWYLFHFWSLSIEEQFYLVWPAALILLLRLKPKTALAVVVIAIATSAVLKVALCLSGATTNRMYYGSDTRADSILIGCLGAMLLSYGYEKWAKALASLAGGAVIIVFAFVFVASDGFRPLYLGGLTLVSLCVASIILHVTLSPAGRLARFLSSSELLWIGKRSYGLYLWHWPMYEIARLVPSELLALLLALLLTFAAAALSYWCIEQPFLRLKDRKYKRGSTVGVKSVTLLER